MSDFDSLRGLEVSSWPTGGLGSGLSFGDTFGPHFWVDGGESEILLCDGVAS